MKTSTLLMLGIGGFLLYKLLQSQKTVSLPAPTPLLTTGNSMSIGLVPPSLQNQALNAALVAAGGTPGIV